MESPWIIIIRGSNWQQCHTNTILAKTNYHPVHHPNPHPPYSLSLFSGPITNPKSPPPISSHSINLTTFHHFSFNGSRSTAFSLVFSIFLFVVFRFYLFSFHFAPSIARPVKRKAFFSSFLEFSRRSSNQRRANSVSRKERRLVSAQIIGYTR